MRTETKLIVIGAILMILLVGTIANLIVEDVEGPLIYEIHIQPIEPMAGDRIAITIYCIDSSGVANAEIRASIDGGEWEVYKMNFYACLCLAGGRWIGNIDPVDVGEQVQIYVTAYDDSPARNSADTEMFHYQIET
ncbi:MAG: hypothetical protein BAJATHORv1_20048 [Candidatus Thorarchaeota archaeon]|nr:MAG: hypothetical protein BAJATHORv1_20048 [Candidatus Thorarchaeota archaeon]